MIPAVVLAAGLSSRMGRPKATLPTDPQNEAGETFLTRILRTMHDAEVDDVVVVVGHEPESIIENVTRRGLAPRFVLNRDYQTGQLSSILTGLRAIDRPGVNAMLLTLVDVPLVASTTIRRVVERYRETGAPIVRPVSGERHGHPVLIDRRLFDELRGASPETGAKLVVRAHVSAAGNVDVEDEGAFVDVDTPEDYVRFLGRSETRRV